MSQKIVNCWSGKEKNRKRVGGGVECEKAMIFSQPSLSAIEMQMPHGENKNRVTWQEEEDN